MDKKQFYDFIIKMQAISKIGLLFSKDAYALENYQQISDLSFDMLEKFNDVKFERPNYFARDVYPTPNISVRTAIFDDLGRILLVKESKTGTYSLPGGWCELYDSPSDAAKAEVSQEAGLEVNITRLVGILNRTPYVNVGATPEYVIVFEGQRNGEFYQHCHETSAVGFFELDNLPELSGKLTIGEFLRVIKAIEEQKTIFD